MTTERMKETLTELFIEVDDALKESGNITSTEARAEFFNQALCDARFWLLEGLAEISSEQASAGQLAQTAPPAPGPEAIRKQMKVLS